MKTKLLSSQKEDLKNFYSRSPYSYLGTCVKITNIHKYFTETIHPNGIHSIEAKPGVYPLCCVCGIAKGNAWHIIHNKFFFICSLECEQNFSIGYASAINYPIRHKYFYKITDIIPIWAFFGIIVSLGLSLFYWIFTNIL